MKLSTLMVIMALTLIATPQVKADGDDINPGFMEHIRCFVRCADQCAPLPENVEEEEEPTIPADEYVCRMECINQNCHPF